VLAQQAEEPVTLVATPPIRRAQSRPGSGESWRCDRKEAISGAQGRSAAPRDGAVEYRRGVEMMLRWGRLWRRELCLQNEGRVVLKSRAQSRASLPTRKPQTARPDFIRLPLSALTFYARDARLPIQFQAFKLHPFLRLIAIVALCASRPSACACCSGPLCTNILVFP